MAGGAPRALTARLVDALYVEAMVLADEARAYFDEQGKAEREALAPLVRVGFSCESLKVTTRLMHIIAWLLTRRGGGGSEAAAARAVVPERRLGHAAPTTDATIAPLPPGAQALIRNSIDLYGRVHRLDAREAAKRAGAGSVRHLQERLERAF